MAFKFRGSHFIALAITAALGGWMYTGEIIIGGQSGNGTSETIAQREAKRSSKLFRVRVQTLQPQERTAQLLIRGRTEADSTITIRAETGGTLDRRVVNKGDRVKPGDLLCVIDQGIRKSSLAQAEARVAQFKADYAANEDLFNKGYATQSKLRLMRTGYDAALANLETAKQDLARTEVRATVYGEVTRPLAQTGDNLTPGGICVTLIDTDPMLFIGQVSERNISRIKLGMKTGVQMVTGEQVVGEITYIAPNADPKTRTFRVEIAMDNSDGKLRDGVTATSAVQLQTTSAFLINPSWLTLADNGDIGVRAVDTNNKVYFVPLKILSQSEKGMWVEGITAGASVITLGHEYVAAGETVEPVDVKMMDKEKADAVGGAINSRQTASVNQ